MKKLFLALVALVMSCTASAFEFDGIELNHNAVEVTRQISARGYIYDTEKDCLKGNCQGTEIYMSVNYRDTKQKNKIGQLIVDVPMAEPNAMTVVSHMFNVVYHQISHTSDTYTYQASEDGTTLVVSAIPGGIRLTYNTPYYQK